MNARAVSPAIAAKLRLGLIAGAVLMAAGGLMTGVALSSSAGRERITYAYLFAFLLVWGIAAGSLFFVGLQHLTHAVWSVVLRRVAEMLAAPLWIIGLLFIPVALSVFFPEKLPLFSWADPAVVAHDALVRGKQAYLNAPFFTARAVFYFAIWTAFAAYFVRKSVNQDEGIGGAKATIGMRRAAGPFMPLFGLTVTFASFDWILSTSPRFYSTVFGVYVFTGILVSALAMIILMVIGMRAMGFFEGRRLAPDHLYNLGGLLFAFSLFWAYIAFSQYLLIWYANLPEETFYYHIRAQGGWNNVTLLLYACRSLLPFFLLFSRKAKMNSVVLAITALVVLAGQMLDLYWLIMPERDPSGPAVGWLEWGPLLFMLGVYKVYGTIFLKRHHAVAVGDPLLEESEAFHLV